MLHRTGVLRYCRALTRIRAYPRDQAVGWRGGGGTGCGPDSHTKLYSAIDVDWPHVTRTIMQPCFKGPEICEYARA